MENASKALIMAGGILIAVIILTIGVYIFATFGGTSQEIQRQVDSRVLAEFNNNFVKYQGSKKCTMHDIVSLTNFAKKYNQGLGYTQSDKSNPYYINVMLGKSQDLTIKTDQELIELLNTGSTREYIDQETGEKTAGIQYYTCELIKYDENNRVNYIMFKSNSETE